MCFLFLSKLSGISWCECGEPVEDNFHIHLSILYENARKIIYKELKYIHVYEKSQHVQ